MLDRRRRSPWNRFQIMGVPGKISGHYAVADLDAKIKDDAGETDQLEYLRLATTRLRELVAAVGPHLANADWHRRRDMIRTLVQRIEIGPEVIKIVFRITLDTGGSGPESIFVTLSRV